jgi:hypothetical protein
MASGTYRLRKYKRKMELEYDDLIELRDYIVEFSQNRATNDKKVNKDILIQEASRKIKELQ